VDHYNLGHYSSDEPAVPSADIPTEGGEWTDGLYVDNEHAVWASPVAFDHYAPNPTTGPSGTLITAYGSATAHGTQTVEDTDVTGFLDDNGNLCVFVSPAPGWKAPSITPTYDPDAGPGQQYQLWWGGDLSQSYSRLRYTFSAPSYRYLYETLTLFGSVVPPLRHLTRRDGLNSTAGRVTGGRSQQGTSRRVSGHW
jgi:hypothetical protein